MHRLPSCIGPGLVEVPGGLLAKIPDLNARCRLQAHATHLGVGRREKEVAIDDILKAHQGRVVCTPAVLLVDTVGRSNPSAEGCSKISHALMYPRESAVKSASPGSFMHIFSAWRPTQNAGGKACSPTSRASFLSRRNPIAYPFPHSPVHDDGALVPVHEVVSVAYLHILQARGRVVQVMYARYGVRSDERFIS